MVRICLFAALSSLALLADGQDSLKNKKDTITLLSEVVVHAYANDRSLQEVPASVGLVGTNDLERFSNTSFLPAINAIPGVRMEERSPGSYRFAIRGSSLRAPFGVRNVKMYWNGLPLTDGGGNTYLNLVDFSAVEKIEIIKGPGGSLYGAGTGGVALLNTPASVQNGLQFSALGGSFGLQRYQASAQTGNDKMNGSINYGHQEAQGYREQTAMRRDAFNTDWRFKLNSRSILSASVFYSDLYYQTPGGLTKAQYDANPRQARPAGGPFQSAVAQQAAVYNKTFYAGLMFDYQWNEHWSTRAGLYGATTNFINPTIRNYEVRKENNWGGRTETQYQVEKAGWKGKLTFGGEYQHFFSPLTDYDNLKGIRGNIQQAQGQDQNDKLYSSLALLFAQTEIDLPRNFYLTLGGSYNFLNYEFTRLSPAPIGQKRNFKAVLSPRIALLKKITENLSLYASASSGFSPPSLAEVRPSTGNYNASLNPERGTSFETGVRGRVGSKFSFDITAYHFNLDQTIVVLQQSGADYYTNAGSTFQRGLEAMVAWTPVWDQPGLVSSMKLWSSYTVNRYKFNSYVQNNIDYSGHKLTGVSPNIVVGGIDVQLIRRVYANVTVNYVDKIPVNDANDQFAPSYFLVGMRIGYKYVQSRKSAIEFFAGLDNATDKRYSLGNDLNATGARYYNAAPGRNFYAGVKFSF